MKLISIAAVCSLMGIVACSSAPPTGSPDYEVDSKNQTSASKDDAPPADDSTLNPTPAQQDPSTTTPADPPKTTSTFTGTLAATTAVPFGGTPYCKYSVTLKTVSISITKVDGGDITAAEVKDQVNETAIMCQYPPMKPADQVFTLKTATSTTDGGAHLEFNGAGTNEPKTDLIVDLAVKDAGYTATAKWHRTDQGAPLAWTVNATVPLAKN
jgi:hypothetical protein